MVMPACLAMNVRGPVNARSPRSNRCTQSIAVLPGAWYGRPDVALPPAAEIGRRDHAAIGHDSSGFETQSSCAIAASLKRPWLLGSLPIAPGPTLGVMGEHD